MHAAAFLRERRLVLDSDLKLDPCELRRIVVHELFHFAWVRLGNQRRREWEAVLRNEVAAGAGGELGWSAEWRKAALSAQRAAVRDRRWREYACEAFCDTAAFLFALKDHPEFTLAPRFRKLRRNWFGGLLRNIVRL